MSLGAEAARASARRHGIDPALAERLAAQDSPDGESHSLEDTVRLDRLDGVLRAGRVEPATPSQPRGKQPLILPNQPDQHPTHAQVPLDGGAGPERPHIARSDRGPPRVGPRRPRHARRRTPGHGCESIRGCTALSDYAPRRGPLGATLRRLACTAALPAGPHNTRMRGPPPSGRRERRRRSHVSS